MTYDAMRSKMEKGVTGTGKQTLTDEAKVPKVKDEGAIGGSFKAGPNDPCPVPYKHGMAKSE